MACVKVVSGVVVQTWRDVPDVAAAVAKYGLDAADLVNGDHPPGTLWDGTIFSPPPPPPPHPPVATGTQMIYEADERGRLVALLAALSQPQRAKLYARRRIIAGDDIAEALRARLSISVAAMETFIAAASARDEV